MRIDGVTILVLVKWHYAWIVWHTRKRSPDFRAIRVIFQKVVFNRYVLAEKSPPAVSWSWFMDIFFQYFCKQWVSQLGPCLEDGSNVSRKSKLSRQEPYISEAVLVPLRTAILKFTLVMRQVRRQIRRFYCSWESRSVLWVKEDDANSWHCMQAPAHPRKLSLGALNHCYSLLAWACVLTSVAGENPLVAVMNASGFSKSSGQFLG